MSEHDHIILLKTSIKNLNLQIEDLEKNIHQQKKDCSLLISRLIEKEMVLAGSKWKCLNPNKNNCTLMYTGSVDPPDDFIKKMLYLMDSHSYLNMDSGIEIEFLDKYNELYIYFDEFNKISEFSKKYKMIIDVSCLHQALDNIKIKAVEIELMLHKFQV